MKVQCTKIINEITGQEQATSASLTVGSEYVVLAVQASPDRSLRLRLMGNDGQTPALFGSEQFVTVCTHIPSNWRARVGTRGELDLAPALWLRPGFWEDYFNGVSEAMRDFATECTLIQEETG